MAGGLLVLEGLDKTGKTSVAERLVSTHGFLSYHQGPPPPGSDPVDLYTAPVLRPFIRTVFDRYHLGERVWPHAFNRPSSGYGDVEHLWTELALMSRGALLVWMDRSPFDPVYDMEPYDAVKTRGRFRSEFVDSHLLKFQETFTTARTAACRLVQFAADEWARAAEVRLLTPGYVGHPRPDVLLVGEQCNGGETDFPFAPRPSTCGRYLMDHLNSVDTLPRIAIVNAFTRHGQPEPLREIWMTMGEPLVVALGKVASRRLRAVGIDHNEIEHPQYARRFLKSCGPDYYTARLVESGVR